MGRKYTNESIDAKIQSKDIKRLGDYVGISRSIEWECMTCRHVWKNTPSNIMYANQSCPKCAGQVSRTDKEIDNELSHQGRSIRRLESTKGDSKRILWTCDICKHEWKTTPTKILKQQTGCPKCAGRPAITNQDIDDELVRQGRDIRRLGDYVNASTKIKWQCLTHDEHTWFATPKDVIRKGTGCPHCRTGIFGSKNILVEGVYFRSAREGQAYKTLLTKFTKEQIRLQVRYNHTSRHTCDFYIPHKKWWIEIGNIKTPQYLKTLRQKQKWVEDVGEVWYHFDSNIELEQFLSE